MLFIAGGVDQTMSNDVVARIFTMLVCLAVLFWSGCANFIIPERGAIAREDSRIALPDDGVSETLWGGKDLQLSYSITGTGGDLLFSGHVVLDRSITDSFGAVRSFFLKMSFLDGDGHVLETVDITPLFTYQGAVPEKMNIKRSLIRPAGSKAIVFSYYGVFVANYEEGGGTDWTILSFPFD
jgi:hypothetical protein